MIFAGTKIPVGIEIHDKESLVRALFQQSKEVREIVKSFGGKLDRARKCYIVTPDDTQELIKILKSDDYVSQVYVTDLRTKRESNLVLPESGLVLPPDLFNHQNRGVNLAWNNPRFGFFMEPGTGKTRMMLEVIRQLNLKKKGTKFLVVCPLAIIEDVWMNQCKQYTPELRAVNLRDPRMQALIFHNKLDFNIGIINFESFRSLLTLFFQTGYDGLIIDESSKLKDPKSQITRLLIAFSPQVERLYCLSGTPAPNSDLDWWGQLRTIDGSILGTSFFAFRNRWFSNIGAKWTKYVLKGGQREEMLKRISKVAIFVKKSECLDLPEKIREKRTCTLNVEEETAYKDMMNTLTMELNGMDISAPAAIAKIMKLRQITAGFIYDATKASHKIGESKQEKLDEILEELEGQQAIIWIQFQAEAIQIVHRIDKIHKASTSVLIGGMTAKERTQSIEDFRAGRSQYLIAHPASAGHGLSFVNCHYAIYVSVSYSFETITQSEDRLHRPGQRNPVTYYYILANRKDGGQTVDHAIYNVINKKAKLHAEIARLLSLENR